MDSSFQTLNGSNSQTDLEDCAFYLNRRESDNYEVIYHYKYPAEDKDCRMKEAEHRKENECRKFVLRRRKEKKKRNLGRKVERRRKKINVEMKIYEKNETVDRKWFVKPVISACKSSKTVSSHTMDPPERRKQPKKHSKKLNQRQRTTTLPS